MVSWWKKRNDSGSVYYFQGVLAPIYLEILDIQEETDTNFQLIVCSRYPGVHFMRKYDYPDVLLFIYYIRRIKLN